VKQILTIAANTYRLIFRKGTGWSLLAALSAIVLLIFFQAQADGVLLHELRLRIRYAFSFAIVFLSICMLFISCLSIRGDIDLRIMHVLTVYPVSRWRIWLGKWLGCLAFSAVGICVATALVSAAAVMYRGQYVSEHGPEVLGDAFWRAYRIVLPDRPTLAKLVDEEIDLRRRQLKLPSDQPEWQIKKSIREDIRREEQLVAPAGKRTWEFTLAKRPVQGRFFQLEFCFFAKEQRQRVAGGWQVEAVDAPGSFTKQIAAFPYTTHRIKVPENVIPPSGKLRITFSGANSPYLIFARGKGIRLLVDDGSLLVNTAKAGFFLVLHFAAVIATGLTLAIPLTLPVAVFVSLVLYLTAVASHFFSGIAQELGTGEPSLLKSVSEVLIRGGLWFSKGLCMPPVSGHVAEGFAIPFGVLISTWGSGFGVFIAVVAGVGMIWLTQKELDRIH